MRKKENPPFYESRRESYDCHIWYYPNYPLHMHKHLEVVYIVEGRMNATVCGKSYELSEGDCLLIYPNQIHSYSSDKKAGMLLMIADMDYIGEFHAELTCYEMEYPCFQKARLSYYGQEILGIMERIGKSMETRPYQQSKGLLMALLADIYENIPMIKKDHPGDLSTIQKLLQYINENITKELAAGDVAKKMGISRYYLSHLLSSQLKISFPAYVAQQRMVLACKLLMDVSKTVTEVSYESGFTNLRAFHRNFRKAYGCTPGEWRRQHWEKNEEIRHFIWEQDAESKGEEKDEQYEETTDL